MKQLTEYLMKSGWELIPGCWPPHSGFKKQSDHINWQLQARTLTKHKYVGVNSSDAVRVGSQYGHRLSFSCNSNLPSRMLISPMTELGALSWLMNKILIMKGYKTTAMKLSKNHIYHQDKDLLEKMLKNISFLNNTDEISQHQNVINWELQLIPGHLVFNITLKPGLDDLTNTLNQLFQQISEINQTLKNTSPTIHHTLTSSEIKQLKHRGKKNPKAMFLRGSLTVLLFLITPVFLLFGLLYWLL